MEDLRNQDVDITAKYVKRNDSFTLVLNSKSHRLTEEQFRDLHNKITDALGDKLIAERKL
jgi:hypothetical protein